MVKRLKVLNADGTEISDSEKFLVLNLREPEAAKVALEYAERIKGTNLALSVDIKKLVKKVSGRPI